MYCAEYQYFVQKAYPATGSVDLFRVHLSKERYSSSGVPKICTTRNIRVLHKRLTPLLAVLISSECTRAERGVPARGCLYLQCGGTPTCDVPVAGLLK